MEPSSLSSAHAHLQTPHWDDSMLYVSPSAQPAQLPVSPVSNYPSPPSAGFVIPPKLEHAKKVPLEVETSSVYPANSASLDERQKAEVDAYLARQDTKERPPSHMIERARRETDWKAIRHMNPAHEVVEELLRMTTKNQKNSTDAPKRPMNGESSHRESGHELNACALSCLFPFRTLLPLSFYDLHVNKTTGHCQDQPEKCQRRKLQSAG